MSRSIEATPTSCALNAPVLLASMLAACAAPRGASPAVGHAVQPAKPAGSASASACRARWTRSLQLLDLLDLGQALAGEADEVSAAQQRTGSSARRKLARLLGLDPIEATKNQLYAGVSAALAAMPPACAQRRLAEQGRALLAADRLPRSRTDALRAAVAYKRVLLAGGALADNARLRLTKWCSRAFRQAVRAAPRDQQRRLNECLYALFEADPAPYFEIDPLRRPPDPPWTVLRRQLRRSLEQLRAGRFASYADMQLAVDAGYFRRVQGQLPSAIDLARLQLRESSLGLPLDRLPVVAIGASGYVVDSMAVALDQRDALVRALRQRTRGDERKAFVVVGQPTDSSAALFTIARAARNAGLTTLYLGVKRRVANAPPAGDVQAQISRDGLVWRLEGLPLSLALVRIAKGPNVARDQPRRLGYDPRAVHARLALTIDGGGLTLSSRDGRLHVEPGSLLPALHRLRAAYPDEGSLIIAPSRRTRFAQLVQLVERVRLDGGEPLFAALALATPSSVTAPARDLSPLLDAHKGR